MNFSEQDFIPVEEVLRQITKTVLDTDYRAHTKGYYKLLIQNCLEELSYDAHFGKENFTIDVPSNLQFELPENAFNPRELYLFNGKVCNIGTAQKLWWARNYFTAGSGSLKKSRADGTEDPFYPDLTSDPRVIPSSDATILPRPLNSVYYYNIQGGKIMISPNSTSYAKIFMRCDYIPDIEKTRNIPRVLRKAIVDWCSREALKPRLGENARFDKIYQVVDMDLNGRRHESEGSWYKAEERVQQMDYGRREDLMEYYQRFVY